MKALILGLALLTGACSQSAQQPAQHAIDRAPHVQGAVVLVRTPRHLEAALETADTMRSDARFRSFRVLVCGEAVNALLTGSEFEPSLQKARSAGVHITACGMSLRELGVDAQKLSPAVDVVPNALAEALRLQADGWVSVEL